MIRLRGNTKHTQKNGWEPADITVELTLETEEDYRPGTIDEWTLRVHQELRSACDDMNGGTATQTTNNPVPPTANNPFSTIKPS